MVEFYVNGEKVEDEEAFVEALNKAQEYMVEAERLIRDRYNVSSDTASAIHYLRTRSRWTLEKETELVDRDHAGDPIPLGKVLSGEF